jgi:hypothetical protein
MCVCVGGGDGVQLAQHTLPAGAPAGRTVPGTPLESPLPG